MDLGGNTYDEKIEKMVSYLLAKTQTCEHINKPIKHKVVKLNKFIKVTEDNIFAKKLYEYNNNILIWGKENSKGIDIFFTDNNRYVSNIYLTTTTINIVQLCNKDRSHFGFTDTEYINIKQILDMLQVSFPEYEWTISGKPGKNMKVSSKYINDTLLNDIVNIYKLFETH